MFPPQQSIDLDLAALSGICGSISIACWIVVFSPQIIKNFQLSSADGLSIKFLVIWLAGDVFNILGGVLQGVLPTMLILAVYYTFADIVLIGQVFYYRGFTLSDHSPAAENGYTVSNGDHERRPLLHEDVATAPPSRDEPTGHEGERRYTSFSQLDGAHLSPVTPLREPLGPESDAPSKSSKSTSLLKTIILNIGAVLMVCSAGILGWWLSQNGHRSHHHHHHHRQPKHSHVPDYPEYDAWGQFFGYVCAALYLGSRLPQIKLNYDNKSCEGLSFLFFLFACLGNLTFDISIFAYDPTPVCIEGGGVGLCGTGEAKEIYLRYLGVNTSWIIGSFGCLLLDLVVFAQFFMYRKEESLADLEEEEWAIQGDAR
jgi:solute carrier family 66 (lysosomal lysine-arginine transporter), member 1